MGGLADVTQLVQVVSLTHAVSSAQHEASRQASHVGSFVVKPQPALPLLVDEVPVAAVVVGEPLVDVVAWGSPVVMEPPPDVLADEPSRPPDVLVVAGPCPVPDVKPPWPPLVVVVAPVGPCVVLPPLPLPLPPKPPTLLTVLAQEAAAAGTRMASESRWRLRMGAK